MDKLTSSKLELALVTPDAIEIWNIVVKARGLYFILNYETHHPTLFVGTKDKPSEPLLVIDTRKKSILKFPLKNPDAALGIADLEERLHKIGLAMTIRYSQDKQKRKDVSLRLVPTHGGAMTTVLDRVQKGQSRYYVQFALNHRW